MLGREIINQMKNKDDVKKEHSDPVRQNVQGNEKNFVTPIIPGVLDVGDGSRSGREEHRDPSQLPPTSNKGGDDFTIRINPIPDDWENRKPFINGACSVGLHYLTLTLFTGKVVAVKLYMDYFYNLFGELQDQGFGTVGYRSVLLAELGFKIAYEPMTISKKHNSTYVSFIIPGAACEALDPGVIREFLKGCLAQGVDLQCTRLDYKFDNIPFSPYQFRWLLDNKVVHLLACRNKIKHITNNDYNDLGQMGSMTVYVGSNSSERVICCYDTHGFTRFEVRNKKERADSLLWFLMANELPSWAGLLLGAIQDYVYFDSQVWNEFINGSDRAYMKLEKKEDKTLEDMERWLFLQVSAALSTVYDIKGGGWLKHLVENGREKRAGVAKYGMLLHRYGLDKVDD